MLVTSGYRGGKDLADATYKLEVGDPDLRPELNRATQVYVQVDGVFLGGGALAAGHRSERVDNYSPEFTQGVTLTSQWWPQWEPAGTRRRFWVSGGSREGDPNSPNFRERVIKMSLEFSEDGYTLLRGVVLDTTQVGTSRKNSLSYTIRNLPYSSTVDYPTPLPPRRLFLFRVAGRDKQAHLPLFRRDTLEGGQTGFSTGLDWTNPGAIPEIRVGLLAPLN